MNKFGKQFLYILAISILCAAIRYITIPGYTLINSDSTNVSKTFFSLEDERIAFVSPGSHKISIDDAKEMYDNGLGLFIDAREPDDFNEGHILSAINVPFENIDDYEYESVLDSLANLVTVKQSTEFPNGWVEKFLIVYCSGEGCSLSEDWAYAMSEYGPFHNGITIFYFEEGFPVWEDLGYPIDAIELGNSNITKKPFLNFIDYVIILSMIIISMIYFNESYKYFIPIIARLLLGFIFIYFSWDKILDPNLFSGVIQNYDIVPFGIEGLIALILPYIEFLIGLFLILGVFLDISAIISLALLVMFIIMIGQAYLRGKSIDCGCLLSDLSDTSSSDKRLHMVKRIIQDICFILYALIVKYRALFKIEK